MYGHAYHIDIYIMRYCSVILFGINSNSEHVWVPFCIFVLCGRSNFEFGINSSEIAAFYNFIILALDETDFTFSKTSFYKRQWLDGFGPVNERL